MLAKFFRKKIIIPAMVGGACLFLFVFFGPPDVYTRTSSPEFCASCHVMEYQHDAWFKTGVHRQIKCVDCHLPNDNFARHMVWKGIDGTKDVVLFYGRMFSGDQAISGHGKAVAQENCVRCHEGTVSRITMGERTCWSCHRRITHKAPLAGGLF
ncbi:MAG: NapC/NirT family cytochrome c [Thermodesulfobacteriota bacterium]